MKTQYVFITLIGNKLISDVGSRDIVVEMLYLNILFFHNGFDGITDRDESHHFIPVEDGQMSDAFLQHNG